MTGKILIIPDIHTKFVDAETIIKQEKPAKTIFLGDYFDEFDDSLDTTEQTAIWLKGSLEKPDRVHLLGNHDLSYLDPTKTCSGFTEAKLFAIKKTGVDLKKLQYFCWIKDWLCTHAGLSKQFLEFHKDTIKLDIIKRDGEFAGTLSVKNPDVLFSVSAYRGGKDEHGGIVWCDYNEFTDIPGIKQIFGHTRSYKVRQTTNHICLDTGLHNYAVYENDTMIIKEFENEDEY